MGLTEYTSITRALTPRAASWLAADSASGTVMPAAACEPATRRLARLTAAIRRKS